MIIIVLDQPIDQSPQIILPPTDYIIQGAVIKLLQFFDNADM